MILNTAACSFVRGRRKIRRCIKVWVAGRTRRIGRCSDTGFRRRVRGGSIFVRICEISKLVTSGYSRSRDIDYTKLTCGAQCRKIREGDASWPCFHGRTKYGCNFWPSAVHAGLFTTEFAEVKRRRSNICQICDCVGIGGRKTRNPTPPTARKENELEKKKGSVCILVVQSEDINWVSFGITT